MRGSGTLRRLSAAATSVLRPACARPLSTNVVASGSGGGSASASASGFSSGSGSGAEQPSCARVFLRERGYTDNVAEGILKELTTSWGVAAGSELPMVKALAGAWEVGADAGLDALAKAVERELARTEGKRVVSFVVRTANEAVECQGFEGMSLKDVIDHGQDRGAQTLAQLLECACSGVMACSTCHVYVEPSWLERVGEPCEAEQDMLDLAHEPQPNSRLGCQLTLRTELEGMVVHIPGGANNLMDHIPFEG